MTVDRFVDEVSSNSPAPGGGSVAALAGSLGAALAAMVANLTVGKAGYESAWASSSALAERAQALKAALLARGRRRHERLRRRARGDAPAEGHRRREARARGWRSRQPTRRPPRCRSRRRGCAWTAIELAEEAARTGNRNSASDAGVGALLAKAGLEVGAPERAHQPAVGAGGRVQGGDARRDCRAPGEVRRTARENSRGGRGQPQGEPMASRHAAPAGRDPAIPPEL